MMQLHYVHYEEIRRGLDSMIDRGILVSIYSKPNSTKPAVLTQARAHCAALWISFFPMQLATTKNRLYKLRLTPRKKNT